MSQRFSASQAGRLMQCPGSGNLDLAIPGWVPPVVDPTADTAANRGTHLHSVFASLMELRLQDQEKFFEALAYVTELQSRRRFKKLIEIPVTAEWLPSKPTTTADLVLYTQDELHVLDLKTGRGPVDVEDNEQLMFYAATYAPLAPKAKGVTVHIVQPWADNMVSWFIDTNTLAGFMQRAKKADRAVMNKDTTLCPGDHCKFCPANPHGRGLKGKPLCPVMLDLLYPPLIDVDEILKGDST